LLISLIFPSCWWVLWFYLQSGERVFSFEVSVFVSFLQIKQLLFDHVLKVMSFICFLFLTDPSNDNRMANMWNTIRTSVNGVEAISLLASWHSNLIYVFNFITYGVSISSNVEGTQTNTLSPIALFFSLHSLLFLTLLINYSFSVLSCSWEMIIGGFQ
jgi:hypothetical protein